MNSRSLLLRAALMLLVASRPAEGEELVRAVARATKQPIHRLAEIEINLERSSCFGTCPAYSVQICGHDFSVRYGGEAADRALELKLKRTLTREELYVLVTAFYSRQFFSLPDEYDLTPYLFHTGGDEFVVLHSYTTDAPATFLELRDGVHAKRILLRIDVPEELEALASLIDEAVGTASLFEKDRK